MQCFWKKLFQPTVLMYYKYMIVHNSNISKLKNILKNTSKDGLGYCTLTLSQLRIIFRL